MGSLTGSTSRPKSLNLDEFNSKNWNFQLLRVAQLIPPEPGMDFQDNPNINPLGKEHFSASLREERPVGRASFSREVFAFPTRICHSWIFPAANPENPGSGLSVSQMSSGCSFPEGLEMDSKGFLGMSCCAMRLAAGVVGAKRGQGFMESFRLEKDP